MIDGGVGKIFFTSMASLYFSFNFLFTLSADSFVLHLSRIVLSFRTTISLMASSAQILSDRSWAFNAFTSSSLSRVIFTHSQSEWRRVVSMLLLSLSSFLTFCFFYIFFSFLIILIRKVLCVLYLPFRVTYTPYAIPYSIFALARLRPKKKTTKEFDYYRLFRFIKL